MARLFEPEDQRSQITGSALTMSQVHSQSSSQSQRHCGSTNTFASVFDSRGIANGAIVS